MVVLCGCGNRYTSGILFNEPDENIHSSWVVTGNSDYSIENKDLTFLDTVLRDNRILILGEEAHSHGSSKRLKTRLIKYLHEELSYDVLIFEHDMYLMNYSLKNFVNENWLQIITSATSPNQTGLRSSDKELFEYLHMATINNNPLPFFGMDCAISRVPNAMFSEYLVKVFEDCQITIPEPHLDFQFLEPLLVKYSSDTLKAIMNLAQTAIVNIEERILTCDSSTYFQLGLCKQIIKSNIFFINLVQETWGQKFRYRQDNYIQSIPLLVLLRDRQMADNVLWIASMFPDKKIIVSTSSYHAAKSFEGLPNRECKGGSPMGEYIAMEHGKSVCSMAIVPFQGTSGYYYLTDNGKLIKNRVNNFRKPDGTFESFLAKKTGKIRYVPLNTVEADDDDPKLIAGDFRMQPTFSKPYTIKWADVYDGIFFIKDMEADTVYVDYN